MQPFWSTIWSGVDRKWYSILISITFIKRIHLRGIAIYNDAADVAKLPRKTYAIGGASGYKQSKSEELRDAYIGLRIPG